MATKTPDRVLGRHAAVTALVWSCVAGVLAHVSCLRELTDTALGILVGVGVLGGCGLGAAKRRR